MARATLGPGSLAGSRLTFNAPRPSMAGARGPEPRKRVNQRMDDLRKQEEIASTDVLFYHTLSGFQHWKPAKRHKKDLPKCMMPLEGPITVYINRRGVAPTFQRDMGPIKAPHRTEKPPAAQGLPPITSKVPYFGDYGGAPWLEQGKPHGALGYPKDERKKTKCRKIMGDFCSCYPQQGGGVLQPPPPDKDGRAGPYLQEGSRPEDVEEEKGARRRRDKSIKGRRFAGDVEDEQGADNRSEVEDGDADGRRPYDRAKAEHRTEKDLDNVEKSWGIMEQILKMENEKRKEAEEAARQQALYEAMWDEFDDVVQTSDEEQTHICLQKTKCIPRRCKIWRVGSKIKTSSSEEEPDQEQGPERPSKREADTGLHPHFTSEADHGSGSQRGSTQPQTEGGSMVQQGNTNGEYRAGSIRRSTFGTGQDGYAAPFGPRQEEYPAPFGTRQEGYPAPFGTRQEGYPAAFDTRQESSPASKYYVPCLAGQDFKSSKEQRKSAVSGGVCYSRHSQRRRSAKCKQKKLCESATSIKRHHKQKEKVKREKAPCSRKKYKKCSRRRTADPPSSCGHPRCNFSSRLTYPVELLPYSASHRHAACNPEHRGFQQPTVPCPIKWRDINIGQL